MGHKRLRIEGCSVLLGGVFICSDVFAQSTLFLSTLDAPSIVSENVAAESWVMTTFITGDDPPGYRLDSIALEMGDAIGEPGGFSISLYEGFSRDTAYPLAKIVDLDGVDPLVAGVYTYEAMDTMLSPHVAYTLVATSETDSYAGSYVWEEGNRIGPYSSEGEWYLSGDRSVSGDGLTWELAARSPMSYGVYATVIPEPSTATLLWLGGLFALGRWGRLLLKSKSPRRTKL